MERENEEKEKEKNEKEKEKKEKQKQKQKQKKIKEKEKKMNERESERTLFKATGHGILPEAFHLYSDHGQICIMVYASRQHPHHHHYRYRYKSIFQQEAVSVKQINSFCLLLY